MWSDSSELTLFTVPSNSSSWTEYSALLCTLSTNSGWRFLIAATAMRDIGSSYRSEYHRDCISGTVNLHENLVPRWTIRMSFVCCIPMINAKSSIGFQRPRSFVVIWLPPRDFLFFLLLFKCRRFSIGKTLAVGIGATTGLETTVWMVWIGASGAGSGAANGGADIGTIIGGGRTAVGVSGKVPMYVCDWVRDRAPTRYGVGGIPRLNSTISSSKRFLLIERCELKNIMNVNNRSLNTWDQFFFASNFNRITFSFSDHWLHPLTDWMRIR